MLYRSHTLFLRLSLSNVSPVPLVSNLIRMKKWVAFGLEVYNQVDVNTTAWGKFIIQRWDG